ncbi:MAG: hypothetical protein GY807_04990 [Gammaproteobacteria bacterium]|nr:hypothetical protein [Gammaproteobacteria bacterium]
MNKLTNMMITALIVFGLIIGNTVGAYSLEDFKGPYGAVLEGVVTVTITDSSGLLVPMSISTSMVGRLVANGSGELTYVGYQNVGGFAILKQTTAAKKPGTYSIDSATGIGSASVEVNLVEGQLELPLGALPAYIDASAFQGSAIYEFRFVVGQANGEIDVIGTSLSASAQGVKTTPIGAIVTRGRAWPQVD